VSNETISLLESILKATEPFSKGLVIPLESANGPGIKLLDLEKDLSVASSRAMDIQRLNPELTAAYEAFQDAHILSVLEFRRRESDVDTARAIVREKERMLEECRNELKVINETIHSLLGQEDFKSLKARGDQLRQSLPNDNKEMLERVEQLSNHIGYNYPWQFNLSELQAMIREWYAKTQELEGVKTDKEKVELQLNERLADLRKSSLREDTGPSQLDALRELQRILQLIDNYLQEFRRRRERGLEAARLYSSSQIDQLKEQLSAYGDAVHQTLNRVICIRCPVMYKNRASGLVRLPVQDYDFLSGQQFVSELQPGEWAGGGGDSAMTVHGLASRSSGSYIGTVLLVDEFNDAETFKKIVFDDLAVLDQLAFAVFVRQSPISKAPSFEVMK